MLIGEVRILILSGIGLQFNLIGRGLSLEN